MTTAVTDREDLPTAAFDFVLPPDRIAQSAAEPRDSARLLRVRADSLSDHHVRDLPDLLRPDDLLIFNDTRVIPARLYGLRGALRVEVMLHKPDTTPSDHNDGARWLAFARPGKRLRPGDVIRFGEDFAAELLDKREGGEILLRFTAAGAVFMERLARYGEPPLPPYIKREDGAARQDSDRYQTVYAARDGAVAAPTAGLHFTRDLLDRLRGMGCETAMVTLHVGAGTFLPVKADHVRDHVMHAEWIEIDSATADRINAARAAGRRIVCVGTTALRVVESAADPDGTLHAFSGDTAIFITPGYRFRACDALLTNFHLPRSTLFMLVSAFMGLDRMQRAYAYAIEQAYRFYSFGDTTLLERA